VDKDGQGGGGGGGLGAKRRRGVMWPMAVEDGKG